MSLKAHPFRRSSSLACSPATSIMVLYCFQMERFMNGRSTYNIRSIIFETKNLKSQAMPRDVAQILSCVVTANLGKFAILVSRNGFRKSAMEQLRAISATNEFLILPFEQKDVHSSSRYSWAEWTQVELREWLYLRKRLNRSYTYTDQDTWPTS